MVTRKPLEYVGCAEADAEYDDLMNDVRDVRTDTGRQFLLFEAVRDLGPRDLERLPGGPFGSAQLYIAYGRYVVLWFAIAKGRAALIKWLKAGTPYQHQLAEAEAKARARQLFP
jgi:hypothetical protein